MSYRIECDDAHALFLVNASGDIVACIYPPTPEDGEDLKGFDQGFIDRLHEAVLDMREESR